MVGVVVGYMSKDLCSNLSSCSSMAMSYLGQDIQPFDYNLHAPAPSNSQGFNRNEWWKPNDSIYMKKYFENLRVT